MLKSYTIFCIYANNPYFIHQSLTIRGGAEIHYILFHTSLIHCNHKSTRVQWRRTLGNSYWGDMNLMFIRSDESVCAMFGLFWSSRLALIKHDSVKEVLWSPEIQQAILDTEYHLWVACWRRVKADIGREKKTTCLSSEGQKHYSLV